MMTGVGLLIVAWGLARRLDAAYLLALTGLVIGFFSSLIKGADYEEAIVMVALLAMLVPARREFDRKATLFEVPFSPAWLTAICAVVLASVALGLFAYRHVEYSNQLWWVFEERQDAPRFLRATVGVLVAMLAVGLRQLLRPPAAEVEVPDARQLADAARVIAAQGQTAANLVFLRDKALMWTDARDAFLMYGVQGRTWVALGDPVGPRGPAEPLVKRFLEHADDYQGIPVVYQASRDWLHRYADFGLTFAKLGEQARVRLSGFTLDGGGTAKTLRMTLRRVLKDGGTFRIVGPELLTPALLGELRSVSDEWLGERGSAEKGFSLGFFDEQYLARFPIALIERNGSVEAFANVWADPCKRELSVDLMRYRTSAPPGMMDALFAALMQWGRDQGYGWFDLGVAPLSGLEESPVAPPVVEGRAFRLRARDHVLQLPGPARLQGEVQARVGATVSRLSRRPRAAADPGGRVRAHRGRIPADSAQKIAGYPLSVVRYPSSVVRRPPPVARRVCRPQPPAFSLQPRQVRITTIRRFVISSIANRTPSRPMPLMRFPP